MPPEAGTYYLAHDRGGQVDHHVLYHGTDGLAMERLKAAQVLFLGNSRLMFALDRGALRQFFDELGLTYYVLGFGHTEQDDFPARIIAKYDLRPEVVVVNADGFFWDGQSEWAAKTIEESAFDAWKLQFESEAAHRLRRAIHRVVPQYARFGARPAGGRPLSVAARRDVVRRQRVRRRVSVPVAVASTGTSRPRDPSSRRRPSNGSLHHVEPSSCCVLCRRRRRPFTTPDGWRPTSDVPLVAPLVDGLDHCGQVASVGGQQLAIRTGVPGGAARHPASQALASADDHGSFFGTVGFAKSGSGSPKM